MTWALLTLALMLAIAAFAWCYLLEGSIHELERDVRKLESKRERDEKSRDRF